jgi:hypothetical protein
VKSSNLAVASKVKIRRMYGFAFLIRFQEEVMVQQKESRESTSLLETSQEVLTIDTVVHIYFIFYSNLKLTIILLKFRFQIHV